MYGIDHGNHAYYNEPLINDWTMQPPINPLSMIGRCNHPSMIGLLHGG